MDVTFGLAVSGVGSVVSALVEIAKLCGEMREGHAVCLRLHRQLMDVSDELSAMEKRNELPKSQALSSYRDIVLKYFRFLECYREKRLFSRLVCHYKTMDELRVINEELVMVFRMLHLATAGSITTWRTAWQRDRDA